MNSSMLTSDRATHLRIAITAALAAALVIVVGISAKPTGGAHGQGSRDATAQTMVAKFDRGLEAGPLIQINVS
jgi:hypothetical protein